MKEKRAILMDLGTMSDAIDLATVGLSTQEISRRTGLSQGQIQYRLRTHKQVTDMERGLRAQWRSGDSPILDRILHDYHSVLRMDWERKFLPRIIEIKSKPVRVPVERKA